MLIRGMRSRGSGNGSLSRRPILRKRERGDQSEEGTPGEETLHSLEPVARATICGRTHNIEPFSFITKMGVFSDVRSVLYGVRVSFCLLSVSLRCARGGGISDGRD